MNSLQTRRTFLASSAAGIGATQIAKAQVAKSPVLYTARWDQGATVRPKWIAGADKAALERFIKSRSQSHRLVHLNGFNHQGRALYCAVLLEGNLGKWYWDDRLTRAQLNTFVNSKYRQRQLKMFNGYEVNGQVYYTVLMLDKPSGDFRWEEQLSVEEVNEFVNVKHRGWQLTHLYGYLVRGRPRFDVVVKNVAKRFGWEEQLTSIGLSRYLSKNGSCVPVRLNGYRANGQLRFATFVECDQTTKFRWEAELTFEKLKLLDLEMSQKGYCLTLLNGVTS